MSSRTPGPGRPAPIPPGGPDPVPPGGPNEPGPDPAPLPGPELPPDPAPPPGGPTIRAGAAGGRRRSRPSPRREAGAAQATSQLSAR